ncbi:MAG: hypothetical protein ACI841_000993 [Planctomycetota bacterium]|jgi:hypothetical protein
MRNSKLRALAILPLAILPLTCGCSREEVTDAVQKVEKGMETVLEESKRLANLSREKLLDEMKAGLDKLDVEVEEMKLRGIVLSAKGSKALLDMKLRLQELKDENLTKEKLTAARDRLLEAYRELKRAILEAK